MFKDNTNIHLPGDGTEAQIVYTDGSKSLKYSCKMLLYEAIFQGMLDKKIIPDSDTAPRLKQQLSEAVKMKESCTTAIQHLFYGGSPSLLLLRNYQKIPL